MSKILSNRENVNQNDQWDLEAFYSSDDKWLEEFNKLEDLAKNVIQYKGRLSESAETLFNCLKELDNFSRVAERVYVYAHLKNDQDTSNSFYAGREDETKSLISRLSGEISFVVPEILMTDDSKINEFLKDEKLKHYKFKLDEILRMKPHTLSESEERLLAMTTEPLNGASNIFMVMNNSDVKFPVIKDEDGKDAMVTHGRYISFLTSQSREVRKNAFESYHQIYKDYNNSYASMLGNHIKGNIFKTKARNYKSSIEHFLNYDNVPVSVYDNLLKAVHNYLPALHKYMKLRKKILDVDQLHLYDVYVPLIKDFDKKFTIDEAKEIILKSLSPLGDEYINIVKKGIDDRWIDKYENKGKRSGAFCYAPNNQTTPHVMLNHTNKLRDVYTLMHELGHAIHDLYAYKQKNLLFHPVLPLAETASIFGEMILSKKLMKDADADEKQNILIHNLDHYYASILRQTYFVIFEEFAHEKIKNGITKKELDKKYYELLQEQFGDMIIPDLFKHEWNYIPHIHNTPFYCYAYAWGNLLVLALYAEYEKNPEFKEQIKNILKAGASKDTLEILKDANIDPTNKEFWQNGFNIIKEEIEELKKLVK
ncbi:MAG: oligoendopeptidase F [Spirochaetota bacterium]